MVARRGIPTMLKSAALAAAILASAGAADDPAAWADCDAVTAFAPPEAPDVERAYELHEIGASGLLLDPATKAAWVAILGSLRGEPWLAELDGPSPTNRRVDIGGRTFLLAAACKDHDCYDNSVVVLYDPLAGAFHGEVHRNDQVTLLGEPPPLVATELQRLWREEFRPGDP